MNGGYIQYTTPLSDKDIVLCVHPTLYASALITLTSNGYTKHYFEGTNRICSKIGGGFSNVNWNQITTRVPYLAETYNNQILNQETSILYTFTECLEAGVNLGAYVDLYEVISHEHECNAREPAFYYHSDHLGSTAYLTNDSGQVSQVLNYLPYGEDWVEIHNITTFDTTRLGMYRFNGKEKDYESGFHYYGARYYWGELLTGWLSVDPRADKYPGISPYNYCMWNPVKLVDPDGRDTAFAGAAERALYNRYRETVFGDSKYEHIQKELTQLESAKEVFCIRMGENTTSFAGAGNFIYNSETKQFDVNIDNDLRWTNIQKLSHELKHVDQYLNRQLLLLLTPKGYARFYSNSYSIDDEIEAYTRQGLFGNTWSNDDVRKVYNGKYGLPWYGINSQYSPTNEVIKDNTLYQNNYGHPKIMYHGWEKDIVRERNE